MPRKKILWRLFPSYLIITFFILITVGWLGQNTIRKAWLAETRESLRSRLELFGSFIADHVAAGQYAVVDSLCKEMGRRSATRFTMILPSGKVVGDSRENPSDMDNHSNRPEVQDALTSGAGVSIRYSNTVYYTLMYLAQPLRQNGANIGVIRAAVSIESINDAINGIRIRMALGLLIITVLVAVVSLYFSRRISRPIEELRDTAARFARGELSSRIYLKDSEEIEALALAMNEMAANINERLNTITRQRNEREAILASMVEGVLAVDNDEKIISMNQAAARLVGVDLNRAIGKTVPEIIRNHDLNLAVKSALASPQPVEREVYIPGASEQFLQAHGATLRDANGNIIGALIVLNDVTRIRKLETMRRDFVANVSHELRTPLTTIQGFVETLLDGALKNPEEAERFLHIIEKQVDRLNALIADLLSLSRLEDESQRASLELEEFGLRELLSDCLQACEIKAKERSVELSLDCPENLTVMANVPLLEQAIVNLIDNGIKYSEPNSLVAVAAKEDSASVHISVSDKGCGIESEHLSRIFERFYRIDKGRSRAMGGTGLGLAIVKHIVLAHKGKINVESVVGKGTTFTIVLPHN